jgi:hypothetical protein
MGKLAGAVFGGLFIAATSAGTWKAYSYSYETAYLHAAKAEDTASSVQASNAGTKGDRLVVSPTKTVAVEPIVAPSDTLPQVVATPQAMPGATPSTYAVAALTSTEVELPKPRFEPRQPSAADIALAKEEAARAKQREKAKRAEKQKLLLDDAQIAALKQRLNLTPTQEEFWPAVEVTLRDVVRVHGRKGSDSRSAPKIDVNSAEVQQLISAAVPLIMRLSEDQKREVRQLARIMGLETVAQRI